MNEAVAVVIVAYAYLFVVSLHGVRMAKRVRNKM
jgi:hypothetical protein